MKVVWSSLAHITYYEVLRNLEKRWTIKELQNFINLTDDLLTKIKNQQITFPQANKKLGIHKAVIHKNVSLFYKEEPSENTVYVITFFHNRMNPDALNDLLG